MAHKGLRIAFIAIYAGALGEVIELLLTTGHLVAGVLMAASYAVFLAYYLYADWVRAMQQQQVQLTNPDFIIALTLIVIGGVLLGLGKISTADFFAIVTLAINILLGKSVAAIG